MNYDRPQLTFIMIKPENYKRTHQTDKIAASHTIKVSCHTFCHLSRRTVWLMTRHQFLTFQFAKFFFRTFSKVHVSLVSSFFYWTHRI